MALFEMAVMGVMEYDIWLPVKMIAATFSEFRPPSPGFEVLPVMAGFLLHLFTAAFWGGAFGIFSAFSEDVNRGWDTAVAYGVVLGTALWLFMGLLIGPLVDPALRDAHQVFFYAGHPMYGVVTALCYQFLAQRLPRTDF